ncbi:RNA polymerase sigma factor [Herbiconiux liukaitaii]|uniref:RNA polymerase sigma factor n=1 Tax=Herbiconiux liukaitaii TaxID=3342799 RepID=UPI0035BA5952
MPPPGETETETAGDDAPDDALATVFREEWPRILGSLLRFTGDLQLAEDCAQEAFARAAAQLRSGAEELRNPASWITTTAKHLAVDHQRREAGLARKYGRLAAEAADHAAREAVEAGIDPFPTAVDDDRLQLIYMTCHPDLSEEARLCLALRAVYGVPTAEIADLLLVKEATMAARLTRAKKRIQAEGIRLESPGPHEIAERTDDVLATVYLLYTTGHTAPGGDGLTRYDTTTAAVLLARSIVALVPRHLEARGLLALLLLTEARAPARTGEDGSVVTLEHADRSLWDRRLIDEGLDQATIALAGRGRLALQAGISGLHTRAPSWAETDWVSIVSLYDALETAWPSPAVALNRIVAISHLPAVGPGRALDELDRSGLPGAGTGAALERQVWAVRADLLRRLGRQDDSAEAYRRALVGERNAPLRRFLERAAEAAVRQ